MLTRGGEKRPHTLEAEENAPGLARGICSWFLRVPHPSFLRVGSSASCLKRAAITRLCSPGLPRLVRGQHWPRNLRSRYSLGMNFLIAKSASCWWPFRGGLIGWSLQGDEFAYQLAARDEPGQFVNSEKNEHSGGRYQSSREVGAVRTGHKTDRDSDDGEEPTRLCDAVQCPDMVLTHVKIFAPRNKHESLERFFVLEELAALGTAIRIWRKRCQTFGAKRDHSAGRGYRAGAVLKQRGKHRLQLFAVPSA